MRVKCADCGESLPRINYIRRLRPGQQREGYRDPLCKLCWQKDDAKVTAELSEGG